jgi:hypothetical protein
MTISKFKTAAKQFKALKYYRTPFDLKTLIKHINKNEILSANRIAIRSSSSGSGGSDEFASWLGLRQETRIAKSREAEIDEYGQEEIDLDGE